MTIGTMLVPIFQLSSFTYPPALNGYVREDNALIHILLSYPIKCI